MFDAGLSLRLDRQSGSGAMMLIIGSRLHSGKFPPYLAGKLRLQEIYELTSAGESSSLVHPIFVGGLDCCIS
jgi:hypothetical protein